MVGVGVGVGKVWGGWGEGGKGSRCGVVVGSGEGGWVVVEGVVVWVGGDGTIDPHAAVELLFADIPSLVSCSPYPSILTFR